MSREALVVLESSGMFFFPVKTFLRFLLTSLLKTTWKKKMKTPCEESTVRFNTQKTQTGDPKSCRLGDGCGPRGYLQAAEDGEQVVEGHNVAVDRHQAQKPSGTDEQQKDEGHSESRAEEEGKQIP